MPAWNGDRLWSSIFIKYKKNEYKIRLTYTQTLEAFGIPQMVDVNGSKMKLRIKNLGFLEIERVDFDASNNKLCLVCFDAY